MRKLTDMLGDTTGSIAVIAAFTLPCMLVGAGLAIDVAVLVTKKASLQSATDASAVAGARELPLANATNTHISAVALRYAETNLGPAYSDAKFDFNVAVEKKEGTVTVDAVEYWTPAFAHLFSDGVTPIRASATARVVSSGKICALSLNPSKGKSIHLDTAARIEANDCAVYANSTDKEAIRADASSSILAGLICAAGGISGAGSAFSPAGTTDCPAFADPLASRPLPAFGGCTHNDHVVKTAATLLPGVYCKGLKVEGSAKVTLNPGMYVIKDGKFEVSGNAELTGIGVGFVLTGSDTLFEFTKDARIHLEGPETGPMAGLLFFEDAATASGKKSRINSDHADVLLGTFYMPKGTLLIDSKQPVAGASAYTAIIADTIELKENPTLILNSDYEATNVPVPAGLMGGRVVLAK